MIVLPLTGSLQMAEDAPGLPDERLFQSPLSDSEKALRDRYVSEYLKDFDPFQATLRMGFLHSFAIIWGPRLHNDPYVQYQISELTRKVKLDDPDEVAADKALIISALREAAQRGPYASRVSAVGKLAEIRGLAKPDSNAESEQGLINLFRDFASAVTP